MSILGIQTFKMSNGDEIIATVTGEKPNAFIIENPLLITLVDDVIVASVYMNTLPKNQSVHLNKATVNLVVNPEDTLKTHYKELLK